MRRLRRQRHEVTEPTPASWQYPSLLGVYKTSTLPGVPHGQRTMKTIIITVPGSDRPFFVYNKSARKSPKGFNSLTVARQRKSKGVKLS